MIHPHLAPLIFGTAVIIALALYLFWRHPSPGNLSEAHGSLRYLTTLKGCTECHTHQGIAAGCLNCHEEIAEQLETKTGYHAFLLKNDIHCVDCHSEHNGSLFSLMGDIAWQTDDPNQFNHPHVDFNLVDRHTEISCDDCHFQEGKISYALEKFPEIPRKKTFLGLDQECISCHEDVHAGGLASNCSECHGQNEFKPATFFDHSVFLSLEKGHSQVDCTACHLLPEDKEGKKLLPFDQVQGIECYECHESPHQVVWESDCEYCHPVDASPWGDAAECITNDVHALVGFRLIEPHDDVDCDKCHDPQLSFDERYPDRNSEEYTRREESCQGCHEDIHQGQFLPFHSECMDCHEKTHFLPHAFDREDHGDLYPLVGVHGTTECNECHKIELGNRTSDSSEPVRRFRGIPQECASCHEDIHLGQFKEVSADFVECQQCHPAPTSWHELDFDHNEDARFLLEHSHLDVSCKECHSEETFSTGETAIRYKPRGMRCADCHSDIHQGQFKVAESVDCERCHPIPSRWSELDFDHNSDARFALVGVHVEAACEKCHHEETLETNEKMVRFRPMGMRCDDCHFDVHYGQFTVGGIVNCDTCHPWPSSWQELDFDHNLDSQFPLDGTHASVECSKCHPQVQLPNGEHAIQYKPLGTRCEDCHGFIKR